MVSSSTPPQLILYTTLGCHLCEQAQALLQTLAQSEPLQWQLVDIVDSEALMGRYAVRIPVLHCAGASDDLGWPFTLDEVRRYLRANYG